MSSSTAAPNTTRAGREDVPPRSAKARAAIPTLEAASATPATAPARGEYPNATTIPNPTAPLASIPPALASADVRHVDRSSDRRVSNPATNSSTTIPSCERTDVASFRWIKPAARGPPNDHASKLILSGESAWNT